MNRTQLNADIDSNLPTGQHEHIINVRSELKVLADYVDQQDSALQTQFNSLPGAPGLVTYAIYRVKAGGTIGVDCDYTSITAAIIDLSDTQHLNAFTTQIILYIFNGSYLEHGHNNNGLILRNYVHLFGQSRPGVIIKNADEGATAPDEASFSTIVYPATCTIQNLTLNAYRCKYALHADINNVAYDLVFRNVTFQHFGGQGGPGYDIGFGLRYNQSIKLYNCSALGLGVYGHGDNGSDDRDTTLNKTPFTLLLKGCFVKGLEFIDFEEYPQNKIISEGSFIGNLYLRASSAVYDAGANPVSNRGYKPSYTMLEFSATKINELNVDSEAMVLLGKIPTFVGFNERVTNKNVSTLSQGYAVKLLADALEPNSYSNLDEIGFREVDLFNGSGIFHGFLMENVAAGSSGVVQTSGTPQAYFNVTAGAVVYGDALELNASGQVQKKASGETVGYALAAASASGLLKLKMKATN